MTEPLTPADFMQHLDGTQRERAAAVMIAGDILERSVYGTGNQALYRPGKTDDIVYVADFIVNGQDKDYYGEGDDADDSEDFVLKMQTGDRKDLDDASAEDLSTFTTREAPEPERQGSGSPFLDLLGSIFGGGQMPKPGDFLSFPLSMPMTREEAERFATENGGRVVMTDDGLMMIGDETCDNPNCQACRSVDKMLDRIAREGAKSNPEDPEAGNSKNPHAWGGDEEI